MKKILMILTALFAVAGMSHAQEKGKANPEDMFNIAKDGTLLGIKPKYGNIKSMFIPEKIKGITVTAIKTGAFEKMTSLTSVTFPSTLKEIRGNSFNGTSLVNVVIPEGVTNVGGFGNIPTLKSIVLPSTVEWISIYTFWNCPVLESVTVNAENPPVFLEDDGTRYRTLFGPHVKKGDGVSIPKKLRIYVPAGSVDKYKETGPWSFYKGYVFPRQ